MDRQIQLIDITDTSIQTTTNSQSANKDVFYNLNGVRICAPAKNGIVICKQANGKVIIMTRTEGSLTTQ